MAKGEVQQRSSGRDVIPLEPRSPPHSVEAEQSLIGGLLLDNQAWEKIADLVSVEDFYRDDHRCIFRHIGKLIQSDRPADVVTVLESIEASDDKDKAGGVAYLGALAQNTPSALNIRRYAELVRERAVQRNLAQLGAKITESALAPGAQLQDVFSGAEASLAVLRERIADPAGSSLDLMSLAEREPSPPGSILEGLPIGYCTLLAGHGGVGKSLIALYLAVCVASGFPFFGLTVSRRRVRVLSCEDREDVLHWRLSRICAHLGLELTDLAGYLEIEDLVGRDSILWRDNVGSTPAYRRLADRMRLATSEVLFVDGINDTFAGNENDRGHVKSYVNTLLSLIPAHSGALVLIGHVSKQAAGGLTTEGYSGSTGWHNAARARWYLRPEFNDQGDGPERTGGLVLELQKSNHGDAVTLKFSWDQEAHLFVAEAVRPESHLDRKSRELEELDGIVAAIRAVTLAGDYVPAAATGQRTAHHVLSARPEMPESLRSGTPARKRFWRLIEQLRAIKRIREDFIQRKSDRHAVRVLVLTDTCGVSGNE